MIPYNQATNGMSAKLSSTGGLIATYTGLSDAIPNDYSSYTEEHIIKMYTGGNHGFASENAGFLSQIRTDVINWLNGHK
ncbi:MAG: hypothetical protein H6553_10190 [Chitinophagales bacterium]|nr:hypothetical protein [Chitinophagales bacterium]